MSKNISFILGAAIALGGACFGMSMTGGAPAKTAGISALAATAASLDLPIYTSDSKPPVDGLRAELMKHDTQPTSVTKTATKGAGSAQAPVVTAHIDLLINDREYIGGVVFGDLIYANRCTISGGIVSSEMTVRQVSEDRAKEVLSEFTSPLSAAQCQALYAAGAFDFDEG